MVRHVLYIHLRLAWLSFMVISCEMSNKYSDNELSKVLQDRYGEKFKVESNEFNFEINKSQFTAYPVSNPEIKVYGSYSDNQSQVEENYLQMKHCFQAERFLIDFLKPFYDHLAVYANVMSPLQETQTDLPPFVKFVKMEGTDLIVNFHIYLFQTIGESDMELLRGIVEAANYFSGSSYGIYTFRVSFWNPDYIRGRDFSNLKFGFNYKSDKYDDNIDEEQQFLEQELVFEFDAAENPLITEERLFNLISPFNKGKNRQYNRL